MYATRLQKAVPATPLAAGAKRTRSSRPGLVIPCWVACQQGPTPFRQAIVIIRIYELMSVLCTFFLSCNSRENATTQTQHFSAPENDSNANPQLQLGKWLTITTDVGHPHFPRNSLIKDERRPTRTSTNRLFVSQLNIKLVFPSLDHDFQLRRFDGTIAFGNLDRSCLDCNSIRPVL